MPENNFLTRIKNNLPVIAFTAFIFFLVATAGIAVYYVLNGDIETAFIPQTTKVQTEDIEPEETENRAIFQPRRVTSPSESSGISQTPGAEIEGNVMGISESKNYSGISKPKSVEFYTTKGGLPSGYEIE